MKIIIIEKKREAGFTVDESLKAESLEVYSYNPFFYAIYTTSEKIDKFKLDVQLYYNNAIYILRFDTNLNENILHTVHIYSSNNERTGFTFTFDVQLCSEATVSFSTVGYSFKASRIIGIGHRGSGSNKVSKEYLENTLESLNKAVLDGAEFLEFDVQCSSDNQPIIHHDFTIDLDECLPGVKSLSDDSYKYSPYQIPVETFVDTGLKTPWKVKRATLDDFMKNIPEHIGFDIEVKSVFVDPSLVGTVPYPNRDDFVNRILEIVERSCGQRSIFFSTFDPMIVAMLRIKQDKYPVFQLSAVEKFEDEKYATDRMNAFIPMWKRLGVKGWVLLTDWIFKNEEIVKQLLFHKFVVFTYGRDNNTSNGIRKNIEMGITGICSDLVALLYSILKNESL